MCVVQSILVLVYISGLLISKSVTDKEAGAPVSSVTRDLQQLNVEDDEEFPPEGTAPSVVIPNHLQVQNADCSHLSFGSFGAAMSAPYSSATAPVKTNVEEVHNEAANSSAAHVDTRYKNE